MRITRPRFDFDMSGSSVLRGGYGLADDDDVQQEMDDERLQDQKDMQMVSRTFL